MKYQSVNGNFLYKITVIMISVFTMVSCSGSDEGLISRFRAELQPVRTMSNGYKVLDMRSLTDFPRDSVYFFKGEEGGAYINSQIGFDWDGPFVPNLNKRLLFVHNKEVVAYIDCNEEETLLNKEVNWPLPIWVYSCSEKIHGIAREDAKFAVFRYCYKGPVSYPLVQLKCLNNYRDMLNHGCTDSSATVLTNKHFKDTIKYRQNMSNTEHY